jgi:hypothetical protein
MERPALSRSSRPRTRSAKAMWTVGAKNSRTPIAADKYQLILAGPIAAAVLDDAPFPWRGGAHPHVDGHTGACSTRPSRRWIATSLMKAIDPLPLPLRESLVYELVARMLHGGDTRKAHAA